MEPVFGIIVGDEVPPVSLRWLENVRHEWTLVCLCLNLKRMAVLRPQ